MSGLKWFWVVSMAVIVAIGLGAILWTGLLWTLDLSFQISATIYRTCQ